MEVNNFGENRIWAGLSFLVTNDQVTLHQNYAILSIEYF